MKFLKINILTCLLFFNIFTLCAQTIQVKSIKWFGAKGDGKTNDHEAFEKAAAYFNTRGGYGTLLIPKGIYIVGKQVFTGGKSGKPAYEGSNVLYLNKIKNFKIQGSKGSVLRYDSGFRFGAFQPANGLPYEHGNNLFVNHSYAAILGMCIYFDNCENVSITNLELNGNNQALILGGIYGDVGLQLPHYGIFIKNSSNVLINSINAHHFGTDGICVSNNLSKNKDDITISNAVSEYNFRQGLSWVGGNSLLAQNCKFNHNGKAKFSSPPSAGIDIEGEVGPVRNGVFENCEVADNAGLGLGADSGDSGDCSFKDCTFWGTTTWSVWVNKPGFTFTQCKIYGSFAHGYNSDNEKDATKFFECTFEDNPYNGKEPYGNYLIESNGKKRVSFSNCNFIANKKKLCWVDLLTVSKPEEKYQFTNCSFTIKNADYSEHDFVAILRGLRLKNCVFDFKNSAAKKKGLFLGNYADKNNIDAGGNKIIYSSEN